MNTNLLVGNGINIQFNGSDYTPQQIVFRILKNFDREDFPAHIIGIFPRLMKLYIEYLFSQSKAVLSGKYDCLALGTGEKESLAAFKKQYAGQMNSLRITDIGFEDYYLIHDLLCHKEGIENPDQFQLQEAMKTAYLYSIFNDGKLNQLYQEYPPAFIEYLQHFDNIFTTNYDSNLESALGKKIYHLHGQFDKKSQEYSSDPFEKCLPDQGIRSLLIDENFYYLYSNALTAHCGTYKKFHLNRPAQINRFVEKMAKDYASDPGIRKKIDQWVCSDSPLRASLGQAVRLKAADPSLEFPDDYHFSQFQSLEGTLEILGLSPRNDFHLFEAVNTSSVEKCIYYFFDRDECETVRSLLPRLEVQGKLFFESAASFWERFCEQKDSRKNQAVRRPAVSGARSCLRA